MEKQTFTSQFSDATYTYTYERLFGHAAQRNRGRYSGTKVHALVAQLIVNVEGEPTAGTIGAQWRREQQKPEGQRRPVYLSVYPLCGCTQGQHAGQVIKGLSAADVTCSRCRR